MTREDRITAAAQQAPKNATESRECRALGITVEVNADMLKLLQEDLTAAQERIRLLEGAIELPACAAIRNRDGIVIAGRYHGECIAMTPEMTLVGIEWRRDSVQGFMTTLGRFVDRKEAMLLMLAAGRVSANKEAHHDGWSLSGGELASEDLYEAVLAPKEKDGR